MAAFSFRGLFSRIVVVAAFWLFVQISILFHLPNIDLCKELATTPASVTQPKTSRKKAKARSKTSQKSIQTTTPPDWVSIMRQNGLKRSAKHQKRFQERRWFLESQFPNRTEHRFSFMTCWYSAIAINDEWAYRHIWKNGGTTIQYQTRQKQGRLKDAYIRERRWMTLIRDPVNHFLSGWSECGEREEEEYPTEGDISVDERVYNYLQNKVIPLAEILKTDPGEHNCGHCALHSMPQANYLMSWRELAGVVTPQLEFVGAMKELEGVLGMLGLEYDTSRKKGRVYASNEELQKKFPRDISLLSDKTLRAICDFVAVDYFLWDYEPPEACMDLPSLQVKEDLTETDWKTLWRKWNQNPINLRGADPHLLPGYEYLTGDIMIQ